MTARCRVKENKPHDGLHTTVKCASFMPVLSEGAGIVSTTHIPSEDQGLGRGWGSNSHRVELVSAQPKSQP